MAAAAGHGPLWLTCWAVLCPPLPPAAAGSYLCFESSKSGFSKRNKVIKLVDITDIQKVGAAPARPRPQSQERRSGGVAKPAAELGAGCD